MDKGDKRIMITHNDHGAGMDGDLSSYGHMSGNSSSSNTPTHGRDGIDSHEYHFHSTIQKLEDGIQELWKENNKPINSDRTNLISSMSDAMFRKLVTTMVKPVVINLVYIMLMLFISPLFFSFKTEKPFVLYGGIALALFIFANILFDAMIIYKIRKYVIEAVTNKYYSSLKSSWRTFEILFFSLCLAAIGFSTYYLFITQQQLNTNSTLITKLTKHFDLHVYGVSLIITSVIAMIVYSIFTIVIGSKAKVLQKASIIESRAGSEHNAEVAEKILDGSLYDFEGIKGI